MVKEITIEPNGLPFLIGNVKMVANPPLDVLITYELFYWSAKKPERKKLVIEYGNNKQNHDDFFWLINPDNQSEKLSAHNERVIHLEAIANGIKTTESEFQIILEVYQESAIEIKGKNPIGEIKSDLKKISVSSGDIFTSLRGIIKI
jgi:hypothetical protein